MNYIVKQIDYKEAKDIILTKHYLHRRPHVLIAYGLFDNEVLSGVATFGLPPSPNVQRLCGEEYRKNTLEFNRLWVDDRLVRNSESYFIGRCFKLLKQDYPQYFILVSYADPEVGHIGYIYQATNWLYTGKSSSGGAQNVIIEDHLLSQRGSVHRGNIRELEKQGVRLKRISRSIKHRYVYFLKNKQKLLTKLKYNILPYPKSEYGKMYVL